MILARPLIDLDDYAIPDTPAEHAARRALNRLRRQFGLDDDEPRITHARLQRPDLAQRQAHVPGPASGPLSDELAADLDDWTAERTPLHRHRLLVFPPCERDNLLADWARAHGHPVLPVPSRQALLDQEDVATITATIDDTEAADIVVVPDLARWWLRHRHGLTALRALLQRMGEGRQRWVIGCNAWAWPWMDRLAGAGLILPPPVTFAPIDEHYLHAWFSELLTRSPEPQTTFRESVDGEEVLALDGQGGLQSEYLRQLASRSLGVPWIAWHQWQEAIRTEPADADEGNTPADSDDGDTLWLVPPVDFLFPPGHEHGARLVMHSVLVHGGISAGHLAYTLPTLRTDPLVQALVDGRALQEHEGELHCMAAIYPTVRERLRDAGMHAEHQ